MKQGKGPRCLGCEAALVFHCHWLNCQVWPCENRDERQGVRTSDSTPGPSSQHRQARSPPRILPRSLQPPLPCSLWPLPSALPLGPWAPRCHCCPVPPERGRISTARLASSPSSWGPDVASHTSQVSFAGPGAVPGTGQERNGVAS